MFFKNIYKERLPKLGQLFFYLGTFFLASALPISIIFYLVSILISFLKNKEIIFRDKFNHFLFLSSGLIIFSSLNSIFFNSISQIKDSTSILVSLLNWIPLFVLFFTSTFYLKNSTQRRAFSKFLIAGTLPLILSCILQAWFNIYGPFDLFYGLIIWFQKAPGIDEGISGLFSNQNYAGIWLTTCLAFSIFEFKTHKKWDFHKCLLLLINAFLVYFSLLTTSRNALLGIIIIISMLTKIRNLIFITFLPIISIFIQKSSNFVSNQFFHNFNNTFSLGLINTLKEFQVEDFTNNSRIEIYRITYNLILKNPIFGWGGSTFSDNYKLNNGLIDAQHTHNIILEIAYNYGLPVTIILTALVIFLLNKSRKVIYNKKNNNNTNIDKFWFIAAIVTLFSHMNDVTYYDGKISILIWLLLSGLKGIIEERNFKNNSNFS